MKAKVGGMTRDPARRAQRMALLRHDLPTLEVPVSVLASAPVSAPAAPPSVDEKALRALVEEAVRAQVSSEIQALVDARIAAQLGAAGTDALRSDQAPSAAPAASTAPVAQAAAPVVASPTAQVAPTHPEPSAPMPAESTTPSAPMPASTTGVRVVARNPVSGSAAIEGASTLARRAPSKSGQPELSPRCLGHTGLHYQGATQEDATAAWQAMRDRYRLAPENKVLPRRAIIDWLKNQRTVCPDSVHWYGDFVVIRSCPVRAPEGHASQGTDGWWVLFDPNGDGYLRTALFADAFDAPDSRFAGVVPRVVKPAWISEERRLAAAARVGKVDARPFSMDSAEDLSAADFTRGVAE